MIRIGTRDSALALWQARYVKQVLEDAGNPCEICFIKTEGDLVLDTPLPLMGGKGVFTKALDEALLNKKIDIAVHSLKDIPTRLPDQLVIGAVTQRGDHRDVLVCRQTAQLFFEHEGDARAIPKERNIQWVSESGAYTIASSSNRRIGQWLSRYPKSHIVDIRGNVQTRLKKLAESQWTAAIFAAAGLQRLGLEVLVDEYLDWMIPAPAQGAIGVMAREEDHRIIEKLSLVHDEETALCTQIERDVLQVLEGGCSAPVGAYALVKEGEVAVVVSTVYPDGKNQNLLQLARPLKEAHSLGEEAAEKALKLGADKLIEYLKRTTNL
ncbi:hydroxymethylbilane synthase [Balneolaceae bacterium ANBcel3]|nr:hydroxymethylbilane synthase [Balneolaceae bacterium ANBcel3]